MEYIGIPSIVIICYFIGEIFKLLIFKKKSKYKYIPIVVGISGGVLGLLSYFISPEMVFNVHSPIMALSIGIASGLASTGSNELLKKLIERNANIDK